MHLWDGMLQAFGLVLARTSALVLSSPILGFGTGFSHYKIALIIILSMTLYGVVQPTIEDIETFAYGAMMVREVLIGIFLGFLLHLSMIVLHVSGELIGHEMGFMVAKQTDPISGVQTSLITNVYEILFVLGLLALNGHHWLISSLRRSFDRAPVGELHFSDNIVPMITNMFGEMIAAGIVFAAPIMVFLFVISILLGLLARVVPTLNIMEIGFSVRVSSALFGLFAFAPLLEPALNKLHTELAMWIERGLDAL